MTVRSRRLFGMAAVLALAAGSLITSAPAASAADDCASLTAPVYRTIRPSIGAQLLTRWQSEATASTANYGFTDVRGTIGYGSSSQQAGYVAVTRMYSPKAYDFMWVTSDAEKAKAVAAGYVTQMVNFYAPSTAASCTVAVHRYVKGTHVRNAWTAAEDSSLRAAGWTDAGTSFYLKPGSSEAAIATASASASTSASATPTAKATTAAPKPSPSTTTTTATPTAKATTPTASATTPTASATTPTATASAPSNSVASGSDTFSIAIIGDTQDEVMNNSDSRFAKKTAWVAANKDALNIRYVLQTGDLVSYGWLDTPQFDRAKQAMSTIAGAGLPYSVTVGNHDTAAVGWNGVAGSTGYGGSAYASNPECPAKLGAAECKSPLLVRKTGVVNSYFPVSSVKNLGGAYESGKDDNQWSTFQVGSTKWMVLTLELWPRSGVVDWAKSVVANHPDYNVIIQTHHYLDGGGTISTSNGGYGATSPKYLYDQVVSKYSNVKMVFSGHVGSFTSRTDTNNGNTVVSYLGNEIGTSAPLRIVTINPSTGVVKSTVYNGSLAVAGTTSNTIKVIS